MRKASPFFFVALLAMVCLPAFSLAQNSNGEIDLTARVSPTAARPEPARQFTIYVLNKSYADIVKEVQAQDPLPARDKFIDDLKVSPELKAWLKAHDILDLTMPDVDRLITPDDVIHVPEFLLAYQRSNSGGVTAGLPKPRYTDADKKDHPERYKKLHDEYLVALKKFIQARPETANGMELELPGVNPQSSWARIQAEHDRFVALRTPETAQTKYLVAKGETDLDGHCSISGVPVGKYWLSSLNIDANAGDVHLRWDVPVQIAAGQVTRIELTNLNSVGSVGATP